MARQISRTFQQSLMSEIDCDMLENNSTSEIVDLLNTSIVGLVIPSDFQGEKIAFKVSVDKVNFYSLQNNANEKIVIDAKSESVVSFGRDDFLAWKYLKIVSDMTQTADISIRLQTRAGGWWHQQYWKATKSLLQIAQI